MKRISFRTTCALILAALTLSGCDLDTSAIAPPETSAKPAFVCPGDPAIASWDFTPPCGDGSCDGVTVNIVSSPLSVLLGSRFTATTATGAIVSGPITGHTTFTFDGNVNRGYTFGPYTHSVDVVLPDRVTYVPGTLDGSCTGWKAFSLAAGDFRSEGVRVVRILNPNPYEIHLTVTFSSGAPWNGTLLPGGSTPEFDPALGSKALQVTGSRLGYSLGGVTCDTIASYPPPINLSIELTCDLSSTSSPIVACTPDATAEAGEDQPPEIIITHDTLCFAGPGDPYPVVGSLLQGSTAHV